MTLDLLFPPWTIDGVSRFFCFFYPRSLPVVVSLRSQNSSLFQCQVHIEVADHRRLCCKIFDTAGACDEKLASMPSENGNLSSREFIVDILSKLRSKDLCCACDELEEYMEKKGKQKRLLKTLNFLYTKGPDREISSSIPYAQFDFSIKVDFNTELILLVENPLLGLG